MSLSCDSLSVQSLPVGCGLWAVEQLTFVNLNCLSELALVARSTTSRALTRCATGVCVWQTFSTLVGAVASSIPVLSRGTNEAVKFRDPSLWVSAGQSHFDARGAGSATTIGVPLQALSLDGATCTCTLASKMWSPKVWWRVRVPLLQRQLRSINDLQLHCARHTQTANQPIEPARNQMQQVPVTMHVISDMRKP
jgi:hypothetical protein